MITLAKAKTVRIVEPSSRELWLSQTKNELQKKGFATCGSESMDVAMKMPMARLKTMSKPSEVDLEEVTECQLCDCAIVMEFVDGVVRGAGAWAYQCPRCHRANGIGVGDGRGQRYMLVGKLESKTLVFQKVEG